MAASSSALFTYILNSANVLGPLLGGAFAALPGGVAMEATIYALVGGLISNACCVRFASNASKACCVTFASNASNELRRAAMASQQGGGGTNFREFRDCRRGFITT